MQIKNDNLYYVGGYVRDEILGVPSLDIDYCYEGNAIEFSKDYDVIKVNPDFGTVRILLNGTEVDVASTRTESYPLKGHLPVVDKIGCSLLEDLKRRDFTINAMAKNTVTNEIIDFFGGQQDLKDKKIKVLHNDSFVDDPSRILRALKFSVRFGFELDEKTQILQEQYLSNINYDMSYHRLKKELKDIFSLNKQVAYNKFVEQGLYKLLGENQSVPNTSMLVENLVKEFMPSHVWLVYLGCYDLSKFELNGEEKDIIDSYNSVKKLKPSSDFELYNSFSKLPLESILLYALNQDYDLALRYLKRLSNIKILINGEILKNIGIEPGKIYKEIFDYVLKCKLENPSLTLEEELGLIKERFLK